MKPATGLARRLWLGVGGALIVAAGAGIMKVTSEEPDVSPARLEVDISERRLYVYHGGELMNTFRIAVGEPAHPTPIGNFKLTRIIWNPAWVPPGSEWAKGETRKEPGDPDNPMQAAKIYFKYPTYYIHGTSATHSLGKAASHGCIRMNPVDVDNLAQFVQQHGGATRSQSWFDRIRARKRPSTTIGLSSPVPLTIRK